MIELRDKARILSYLQADPYLHLYALGDLDDLFWPRTRWFMLEGGTTVFLLYAGGETPTLLAFEGGGPVEARALLAALAPVLPPRCYGHLSPGLAAILGAAGCRLEPHGGYLKLRLAGDRAPPPIPDDAGARVLTQADLPAILELYAASYPGNWFDPRMLDTGKYLGLWRAGMLVAVAGVHVYSEAYSAAALGNITTHPAHRGKGDATRITGLLCKELRARSIRYIGLNVKADNAAALRCYQKLGFLPHAGYEEYAIAR